MYRRTQGFHPGLTVSRRCLTFPRFRKQGAFVGRASALAALAWPCVVLLSAAQARAQLITGAAGNATITLTGPGIGAGLQVGPQPLYNPGPQQVALGPFNNGQVTAYTAITSTFNGAAGTYGVFVPQNSLLQQRVGGGSRMETTFAATFIIGGAGLPAAVPVVYYRAYGAVPRGGYARFRAVANISSAQRGFLASLPIDTGFIVGPAFGPPLWNFNIPLVNSGFIPVLPAPDVLTVSGSLEWSGFRLGAPAATSAMADGFQLSSGVIADGDPEEELGLTGIITAQGQNPASPVGSCNVGVDFCGDLTQSECEAFGGNWGGNGTSCQSAPPSQVCGNDVVEAPEQCERGDAAACPGMCLPNCTCGTAPYPLPTVSVWGMVALTLLLLTGIAIKFGRRRAVRA